MAISLIAAMLAEMQDLHGEVPTTVGGKGLERTKSGDCGSDSPAHLETMMKELLVTADGSGLEPNAESLWWTSKCEKEVILT